MSLDSKTSHLSYFPGLLGYQPLRRLATASSTYLCREDASDRLVVLKVFSQCKVTAFRNESRALAALAKSGLAPELLFALNTSDHRNETAFALGIEYLPGKSMAELLPHLIALPIAHRVRLGQRLIRSLSALHAQGWTHGDLSPGNILLTISAANPADSWQVHFVDWEFAIKRQMEDLKTSDSFRGTIGFTEWDLDPLTRDRVAMEKLLQDFLGLDPHLHLAKKEKKIGFFAKLRGFQ